MRREKKGSKESYYLFDPRRILIHDIKGENKGIELIIWYIFEYCVVTAQTQFFFHSRPIIK